MCDISQMFARLVMKKYDRSTGMRWKNTISEPEPIPGIEWILGDPFSPSATSSSNAKQSARSVGIMTAVGPYHIMQQSQPGFVPVQPWFQPCNSSAMVLPASLAPANGPMLSLFYVGQQCMHMTHIHYNSVAPACAAVTALHAWQCVLLCALRWEGGSVRTS